MNKSLLDHCAPCLYCPSRSFLYFKNKPFPTVQSIYQRKEKNQNSMPRAVLLKTYDKYIRGIKYRTGCHYQLGNGVFVKLKKERSTFTKYAGWGVVALTAIKKNQTLGYFVKETESDEFVDGRYCFKLPNGKFFVSHEDSLMNKVNTVVKNRKKHCNCKLIMWRGNIGLKTTKNVEPNEFLWADYGSVSSHYWKIQYNICKARVMKNKKRKRRCSEKTSDEENDNKCCRCSKRHLELLMCDLCTNAICFSCLKRKEKSLLNPGLFFCETCLNEPPKYPNRFVKK